MTHGDQTVTYLPVAGKLCGRAGLPDGQKGGAALGGPEQLGLLAQRHELPVYGGGDDHYAARRLRWTSVRRIASRVARAFPRSVSVIGCMGTLMALPERDYLDPQLAVRCRHGPGRRLELDAHCVGASSGEDVTRAAGNR